MKTSNRKQIILFWIACQVIAFSLLFSPTLTGRAQQAKTTTGTSKLQIGIARAQSNPQLVTKYIGTIWETVGDQVGGELFSDLCQQEKPAELELFADGTLVLSTTLQNTHITESESSASCTLEEVTFPWKFRGTYNVNSNSLSFSSVCLPNGDQELCENEDLQGNGTFSTTDAQGQIDWVWWGIYHFEFNLHVVEPAITEPVIDTPLPGSTEEVIDTPLPESTEVVIGLPLPVPTEQVVDTLSPVTVDDCLSDPWNAAGCMSTPFIRQGVAGVLSVGATLATLLVGGLGSAATAAGEAAAGAGAGAGNAQAAALAAVGAATSVASIAPSATAPSPPAEPLRTGSDPPALQDPAAELYTYPVPKDGHAKIARNLKNSLPPRVVDMLTRATWKGLDDKQRKNVVKYIIWQMGKQMEIGKVKVKFREKGDEFKYAGQAFSDKVPPEIKINDWEPSIWDQPGDLLDTLAHEMRHLQQHSEESMMESADVKALATYNKWQFKEHENFKGEGDEAEKEKASQNFYDQFNERDARSMGRGASNAISDQAYKQKLERIGDFYKSTMGGESQREVRTSALDDLLEKHPELRSRVSQLISEGKLKVVDS
jgi:hypothetical protein